MKLLYKGSESEIYLLKNNILLKKRIKKNYRIREIDNFFRKKRTQNEFKILNILSKNNIDVPIPIEVNKNNFSIKMDKIEGDILKKVLDKKKLFLAFENIIKIHNLGVIHNDLTTLNMLYSNNKIFLIDFGLSFISKKFEDKASDLNLFFENIKNEHSSFEKYYSKLIDMYKLKAQNSDKILEKFVKQKTFGRNKNKSS